MGSRTTGAQWLAARQLSEGAAPTRVLVAAAMRVDVSYLYQRARAENWKVLDFRYPQVKALQREMIEAAAQAAGRVALEADSLGADAPGEPAGGAGADDSAGADDKIADAPDAVEMMARASRFVSRQILALMDRADRCGGRLDKSQIDGLVSMSRMMDRWEALARDRQTEDRKKSDEELAGLLKDIDARITVLAKAEAKKLFEKRIAGQAG